MPARSVEKAVDLRLQGNLLEADGAVRDAETCYRRSMAMIEELVGREDNEFIASLVALQSLRRVK